MIKLNRQTLPLSGSSQYTSRAQCSWFIDNKVEKAEFPQEALELEQ